MAAKFLIVHNTRIEDSEHFAKTALAVTQSARFRGFDVLMATHVSDVFETLSAKLPIIPLFRVDYSGREVEAHAPTAIPLRGELAPLHSTSIEAVLDGRVTLNELLDARFAPPSVRERGWKSRFTQVARRMLPGHFPRLFHPHSENTHDHTTPLPANVEAFLRRELDRIPPEHNEFANYRLFAADLERLLTICCARSGDHVYFPAAHGRDAIAILALIHRIGADRLPVFHLEFRHSILSATELEREVHPLKAFHTRIHRAYFDVCRAFPESFSVRYYAHTAELATDLASLAGFPFNAMPVPHRVEENAVTIPGNSHEDKVLARLLQWNEPHLSSTKVKPPRAA